MQRALKLSASSFYNPSHNGILRMEIEVLKEHQAFY